MSKKFFSVPNCGNYIYDSLTNHIITMPSQVSNNDYINEKEIIEGLNEIVWDIDESEFIHAYQTQLHTMVLQMTQNCNLRCKYCVYSGEFAHMLPHSNKKMSLDVARKSVDFLMNHSNETDFISIIFYGGEPLLEFELIKETINYSESFKRKIKFGISTNGTLLSNDFIEWVSQKPNVYVTITINGGKHDLYRVNKAGNGTLNIILDHLQYIKEYYPKVWNDQIRIITNYSSYDEILPLKVFFEKTLQKIPVSILNINLSYASSNLRSQFNYNTERENKIKSELIDCYIHQKSPFFEQFYEAGLDRIINRVIYPPNTPGYIYSCTPFRWRFFVNSDGNMNLCERVSDHLCLGNINAGYDENKMLKLYHDMKDFCNRNCRDCWAQRLCMFCYQDIIDNNGNMIYQISEDICKKIKADVLEYLRMYVRIANME